MRKLPDHEQLSVAAVFGRALRLSHRGQLELHELLTDRLDDVGRAPTKQSKRIERQRRALAAMQPEPSGRLRKNFYWVREEVERWLAGREGSAAPPDKSP